MITSTQREATEPAGAFAAVADVAGASATLVVNLLGHVEQLVGDAVDDALDVARECTELWEVTTERVNDVARAMRAAPRFARIAGELIRIIAAYRWHAAISGGAESSDSDAAALDALHAHSAERLYALCVELRGGVLKLGQFASTRIDLLPAAYVTALSRLQDRVPPVPAPLITARVADELGAPAESIFGRFDSEPIAAASLAQVHAAELADGTRVAVKVQIPGIEDVVETDIAAMSIAVPTLRDLLPFVDGDTVAEELTRALRAELDYVAEAEHAMAFARLFADDPDIVVPRVHRSLSTRRVLVLEQLVGERLTDYLDACEQRGTTGADDRDRIFTILLRAFCAQVLEHGLLQGDPHPGNFLVLPGDAGPRLALLDFGCVQAYGPARRRAYAELCLATLRGDAERMAALFEAMGFRSRDGGCDALRAFADLLLGAFRADATLAVQDIDARAAMERILRLTRENPIVAVPGDFVLLGRVFTALGGLLMRYRPRVNLFQLLMPPLLRAMQG
jgi:predicted unusual protein kinase regulating ubiquinone biosynthesis (AarF/ABC1/UbiB family)